ncbi:MAG: SCP2 sterol-binding domain-containing protein [Gammaproteobacteria bacterium]|nr:SCP2 sterol-binding domain-containing protein [Gammaproteobacteria bacterium]
MMLAAALSAAIETAANQLLRLDPAMPDKLAGLSGKTMALQLREPKLRLVFAVTGNTLRVRSVDDSPVDVELHATPAALLRAVAEGREQDSLLRGDIEMRGDIETGRRFQRLLRELDIDWEEQLSRVSGDIIAHQLGNLARALAGWTRQSGDTLRADIREYLLEERRIIAWRDDVEEFLHAVDTLRDDCERLALRIQRLQQRIAQGTA